MSIEIIPQQSDGGHPKLAAAESQRERFCKAALCKDELFLSFQELVQLLRDEIPPTDRGVSHAEEDIQRVLGILKRVRLNRKEWEPFTCFQKDKYTRTLVGYTKHFAMILLCWERGQMSPIHDHTGASCWVKVLDGTLQEVLYANGTGPLQVKKVTNASVGEVCYINDTLGLHKMGNPTADTRSVSLHIYAPPFTECRVFEAGTGLSRVVSMRAANAPASPSEEPWKDNALSLAGLVASVRITDPSDHAAIELLMNRVQVGEDEWREYVHFSEHRYTRSLVFLDDRYSLMVLCWNRGQATPKHVHSMGTHCWAKAIHGELVLEEFATDEDAPARETLFAADTPCIYEGPQLPSHRLVNASADYALSVHLYTPPYKDLTCCVHENQEVIVPVVSHPNCVAPDCAAAGKCRIFVSFQSFISMLDGAFARNAKKCELRELIQMVEFNPEEWRHVALWDKQHFTRILLYQSEQYMLVLCCWERGQASSVHDHAGSVCWMKVLEGQLDEWLYADTAPPADEPGSPRVLQQNSIEALRCGNLVTDRVTYLCGRSIHSVHNNSDRRAVTLHVYAPPYTKCHCYDVEAGTNTLVHLDSE